MSKSIVTKYMEISAFSGKETECVHHLIWGDYGALRDKADQDGLLLPLTDDEHNLGTKAERIHGNSAAEKLSKMLGQMAFEKEYYRQKCYKGDEDPAREEFRKRYAKSWL